MIDHCIFDLYGTLIDIHTDEDDPAVWRHLCAYYAKQGITYTAEGLRAEYLRLVKKAQLTQQKSGIRFPEIQILDVFGALGPKDLAAEAAWEFRCASTEYLKLYEGVPELLAALRSAGVKLYVLSNAQRAFTYPELCRLGINDCFDDISISSDFGAMKPDPLFYRQILDRHHLDPNRSIMIGNDYTCDTLAARSVGLQTCYVRSNLSPAEDEKRDIRADIIASATDIPQLCKKLILAR